MIEERVIVKWKAYSVNGERELMNKNIIILLISIILIQLIPINAQTTNTNQTMTLNAYGALVEQQQENITSLKEELTKKDKLLAEYISYKKKNIELNKNITELNKKIIHIKTEKEFVESKNKDYKDIITDLINKQSNETANNYVNSYNDMKKDLFNFKIAGIFGVIVCLILGIVMMRAKKKYEIPL
ncbi:hypothetical protein [Methanococcus voltae]|uniref:hypothetical protein n=1 Tax=Methanococcus voltae TaxID=2188 RepID=UPI001AE490E3|nr:hypothetical protein [Methanococcus voltae]